MAADPNWFDLLKEDTLLQGDIHFDFPLPRVAAPAGWPPQDGQPAAVEVFAANVMILTQSCDLANAKAVDVLVAILVPWDQAEALFGPISLKSEFRKAVKDGNIPGVSLLHQFEGPPWLPWSVVNFKDLHVVSREWLTRHAAASDRLRLRSPYREHLAQAFARFFMRVGLPHSAVGFVEAFAKQKGA